MSHTSRYFQNPYKSEGAVKISTELYKARSLTCIQHILKNLKATHNNCDGGLYVGLAGVAYAFYYLARCGQFVSHSEEFLKTADTYITVALDFCDKKRRHRKDQVSFLLENGGVYAVAALISNAKGDEQACRKYIDEYRDLASVCEPISFLENGSDELFVGRSGYLLGILLLQRDLKAIILEASQINELCQKIIESGRKFRSRLRFDGDIPLMYAYHGTLYLGSGHGIAGILQVLLSFPNFLNSHPDSAQLVRQSVDYLLNNCMIHGNIASDLDGAINPGHERMLVHWCHGAAGIIYTFARAYLVFGKDRKYLDACNVLAETVWEKGLLKKGSGICHGIAGSGYVFLLMYRLTGEEKYLHRAERFGGFMFTEVFSEGARTPDCPFSLFEGLAGTVCYLNDLMQPSKAEFPFMNVFLE